MNTEKWKLKASSMHIRFEPPIPVGELLGQHAYAITVRYNVNDSLRSLIDSVSAEYEQAYEDNLIDFIYLKDIRQRINSLDYIKNNNHAEEKFAVICNTLGARMVFLNFLTHGVHEPKYTLNAIHLTSSSNTSLLYKLQQNIYKAIDYIASLYPEDNFEDYGFLNATLYAASYWTLLEHKLKINLMLNTSPADWPVEDIDTLLNPATILKGYSGFYCSEQDSEVTAKYNVLRDYLEANEDEDIDAEDVEVYILCGNRDYAMIIHENGPDDITKNER